MRQTVGHTAAIVAAMALAFAPIGRGAHAQSPAATAAAPASPTPAPAPASPAPSPAPAAPAAPAPAANQPAPKPVSITIPTAGATGLLGHLIESQTDKDIGRIIDVLVDIHGTPQALVIDVGGFMGVGTRRVAIAWSALRFQDDKGALAIGLDVPTATIQAAPEYVAGKDVQALIAPPAQ